MRNPRVTGVVLAAGPGRRFGPAPKLLAPLEGKPLLARVLELVERLPLAERVLVLGAHAQEILAALFPGAFGESAHASFLSLWGERVEMRGKYAWRILYNPDWPEGLGSSLRRAAEEVDAGVLVFLGDMPWVPEEAARAVLSRAGPHPVAPCFAGRRGFPVYLPASLRPKLLALRGDVGARALLSDCELIPWDDPGVILDVDRREDLQGGEALCGCARSPR